MMGDKNLMPRWMRQVAHAVHRRPSPLWVGATIAIFEALFSGGCTSCPNLAGGGGWVPVLVHVVAADTMEPISSALSFSVAGMALHASCFGTFTSPPDLAGVPCSSWYLPLSQTVDVDVSAEGFKPSQVRIKAGESDKCGRQRRVEETVKLVRL